MSPSLFLFPFFTSHLILAFAAPFFQNMDSICSDCPCNIDQALTP